MKRLILITVVCAFMSVPASADFISYGTVGSGGTATLVLNGTELSTAPGTGTAGSAYLRLNIDAGIALNAISSLSYTSMITTPGAGWFTPEVVLNIDADGDGTLEGTGIGWMAANHLPSTLGYVDASDRGDNFLSGDNWPPGAAVADAGFVTRNAIGSDYYYWEAGAGRAGGSAVWNPMSSIVPGMLPAHDIDATDLVYSIDFVVGTSGNFDGMTAVFQSVELNQTTYDAPVVPVPGAVLLGMIGLSVAGVKLRKFA